MTSRPSEYILVSGENTNVWGADMWASEWAVLISVVNTGAATTVIEGTNDDIFNLAFNPASAAWTEIADASASRSITLQVPYAGIRAKQTAGSGSAKITISQVGSISDAVRVNPVNSSSLVNDSGFITEVSADIAFATIGSTTHSGLIYMNGADSSIRLAPHQQPGIAAITFNQWGNLGLNTNAPTTRLHVNFSMSRFAHSGANSGGTNATGNLAAWFDTPKNAVSIFLGDGGSTAAYGVNESSGNIRFNGSGVGWGDVGYYPNGGSVSAAGHFRMSIAGSTIVTEPDAKLGIGSLFMGDTPTAADNAAAVTAGLSVGSVYKTATGEVRIVV